MSKEETKRIIFLLITLVFITAFLISGVSAVDDPFPCNSLITSSYNLTEDVVCSSIGRGVMIRGDNIILDCQGHYIEGNCPPLYSGQYYKERGINVVGHGTNSINITIKNCEIRCFNNTIYAEASKGIQIINNLISETNFGIFFGQVGGPILISSNTIEVDTPRNLQTIGIYAGASDTPFPYHSSEVNITNNSVSGAYVGYKEQASRGEYQVNVINNTFCKNNVYDLSLLSSRWNSVSCKGNMFDPLKTNPINQQICKPTENYECGCSVDVDSISVEPDCDINGNYTCASTNEIVINMDVSGSFCENINGARVYFRDYYAKKLRIYSLPYEIPCVFNDGLKKITCSFSTNFTFFSRANIKKLFGQSSEYQNLAWNMTRVNLQFLVPVGSGLFYQIIGDASKGNLIKDGKNIRFTDTCQDKSWFNLTRMHNEIPLYGCNLNQNYNCVTSRSGGKFDSFCLHNSTGNYLVPIQVVKGGGSGFFENLWNLIT